MIQGATHVPGYMGRRRRKVKKAELKTLYIRRDVLNAQHIIDWAKGQGFPVTIPADEMHVTIAYSRTPFDWSQLTPEDDNISTGVSKRGDGTRFVVRQGKAMDCVVLRFDCPFLSQRWKEIVDLGADWSFPEYHAHITISYQPPDGIEAIASPYLGEILLGPEVFEQVKQDEGWKDGIMEKTLGADADAKDWIDDFVNSDNKKFADKSKEERVRMALGAYYGQKGKTSRVITDEEVTKWVKVLEKAGARHSKSDRSMIQDMHDHAVKLGADCSMAKGAPVFVDIESVKIAKVDTKLGLVFGYAVVCKVNGSDYYDLNIDPDGSRVPEHVPEQTMLKAATDFMKHSRLANEMHLEGTDGGEYIFAFPVTGDIAKAMGWQTNVTGLAVALFPPPKVLAKFESGEYTGFSIEGRRVKYDEHDD